MQSEQKLIFILFCGGATPPSLRNGGMEECYRDPTVGSCLKVWARDKDNVELKMALLVDLCTFSTYRERV